MLKEMGIEDFNLPEKKTLTYSEINETTNTQIINDAVENINEWGLKFPRVIQLFDSDPNKNQSTSSKNIFGIYDLIKKIKN